MPRMVEKKPVNKKEVTIQDLYPNLNEEESKVAEENLNRYLELVLRIYQRIWKNADAYAAFKTLTASSENLKMNKKRSSASN